MLKNLIALIKSPSLPSKQRHKVTQVRHLCAVCWSPGGGLRRWLAVKIARCSARVASKTHAPVNEAADGTRSELEPIKASGGRRRKRLGMKNIQHNIEQANMLPI